MLQTRGTQWSALFVWVTNDCSSNETWLPTVSAV